MISMLNSAEVLVYIALLAHFIYILKVLDHAMREMSARMQAKKRPQPEGCGHKLQSERWGLLLATGGEQHAQAGAQTCMFMTSV